MGCMKCKRTMGILLLLVGLGYLLVDFGMWDFYGISWWTVLFLGLGISWICKSYCKDCCKVDGKKR